MLTKLFDTYDRAVSHLERLHYVPALLARLAVGWVFIESGWGKLHHLEAVTGFFAELGIPAPGFHAPLVAGTELICGALLFIGLFTRLAAVPLIVTMVVAIFTARSAELLGPSELFGFIEFLYIALLLFVVSRGPGRLSLDAVLLRVCGQGVMSTVSPAEATLA